MMQWEKPILPRRITEIAQRLRSSSTDLILSLSTGTDRRHQQVHHDITRHLPNT